MPQFLEGIDNMILMTIVLFAVSVLFLIILGWKYLFLPLTRRVQIGIHPDYQQVVEFTRSQLPNQPDPDNADARPRPPEACPVCMDDITFAVETNCGHSFCGRCIITYWHTGHWSGAVACPMCRATVNLLLPHFSVEEQRQSRENEEGEGHRLLSEIAVYNRRYSGAPVPLWEQLRDLPVILPHLFTRLFSLDGLDFMYRLRIFVILILGALYMLSPVDLLPEIVFGALGIVDDILVVLMVSIYAVSIYRQYLATQT